MGASPSHHPNANKDKKMENETRKFSTLQELLDALYYDTVSAEIISEKRACFKDGTSYECCNFEIPEASEQHFWKEIAKVIWSKPIEANINDLKSSKGWWLRRLTWNGERFEYVAGQDYPYEIRQIRKFVKAQSRS